MDKGLVCLLLGVAMRSTHLTGDGCELRPRGVEVNTAGITYVIIPYKNNDKIRVVVLCEDNNIIIIIPFYCGGLVLPCVCHPRLQSVRREMKNMLADMGRSLRKVEMPTDAEHSRTWWLQDKPPPQAWACQRWLDW